MTWRNIFKRLTALQFLLVLAFAISFMIEAGALADAHIEDDLQSWSMVTLEAPLSPSKKWRGYLEAQPRVSLLDKTDQGHMDSLIIRPAVGYQLNKHVSIWQGYAWVPSFQPELRHEHRIFQQLNLQTALKKLRLSSRTRLEERFIENAGNMAMRARFLGRAAYPLDKAQKWYLVAYDEVFVNMNDTARGPQSGFNQNRAYLGLNRRIGSNLNIDAGYIANYVDRDSPAPDRWNHVILISLNFSVR